MSKIALTGNASGTGVFTIAAPNTNTDRTLTLPDEAGTVDTLQRAGNVLQVVYGSDTTYSGTSSTSYVTTGVTADITPSSTSSKVLILISLNGLIKLQGAGYYATTAIYKDGSVLTYADAIAGYTGNTDYGSGHVSMSYLDSPSSTSTLTYDLRIRTTSAGNSVVWNNYDGSNISRSTITLMEIAG
jgi:hypothetical protein